MNLFDLINYEESDWLDFKKEWHKNTADLILDILCLANSDAKTDRYLFIGYDEEAKQVVDIKNNRIKKDDLFNLLATSNFNRMPDLELKTITINNNEIDILIIKASNHRPYFLLKDKNADRRHIRAGVIYTRNGSSNTPINETASENQIADMWRERFGLNLSPKERLNIYIKDYSNWQLICNDDENFYKYVWHYEPFPEFTIEYVSPNNMKNYSEPPEHPCEIFTHSYGNSYQVKIKFKYHTTIIFAEDLFLCDKNRFKILCPNIYYLYYNPKNMTDIHVFAENSQISDRGIDIETIDRINGGGYNQVCFCYNFQDSFKYYVQKIIQSGIYDIYKNYFYIDDSGKKDGENSDIRCPNKIYLLDKNEDIASRLRQEFLNLNNIS